MGSKFNLENWSGFFQSKCLGSQKTALVLSRHKIKFLPKRRHFHDTASQKTFTSRARSQLVFSGIPEGQFCLSCTFIFRNERNWMKKNASVSEKLVSPGFPGLQVATRLQAKVTITNITKWGFQEGPLKMNWFVATLYIEGRNDFVKRYSRFTLVTNVMFSTWLRIKRKQTHTDLV